MHSAAVTEVRLEVSPIVQACPFVGLCVQETVIPEPRAAQCLDPISGCPYQPDSDGKTVCDAAGCQYTQR